MNNHDTNKLGAFNNILEKPNGFSNVSNVTINEFQIDNGLTEIPQNNTQSLSQKIDGSEHTQERYVWEIRARSPNFTPSSTVLNSPDLNTDIQYVMQQQQRQHHQIRVGRSPGSQFDQKNILPQGLTSPGSPTDVGKADGQCLRDGEIVLFDDIDTNWMNKANHSNHASIQPDLHQNNEDILKVTKMIGQLPIAQYEGSPRRFGNQPVTTLNSKPTIPSITGTTVAYPKRPPGFPQRVSPKNTAISRNEELQPLKSVISSAHLSYNNRSTGNLIDIDDDSCDNKSAKVKTPTFDYLYECSETRKVLEEFFKGNIDDEKRFIEIVESGEDVGICDTHNDCEHRPESEKHIDQAYVGQRLARIQKEDLILIHRSPKKQTAENSFNDHNNIELYIDSNSRSSTDVADTELEVNLRRHSRNFTLSPETTDYDSNCGDLDSLSNDINCPTDYGKLYTSMPVLEDGLSSGHASDTENNLQSVCEKSDNKVIQQLTTEQNKHNGNLRQSYEIYAVKNNPTTNHIDPTTEPTKEEIFQLQQSTCNDILTDEGHFNINPYNNSNDLKESQYEAVYAAATTVANTPATPPAPTVHHQTKNTHSRESADILEAMREIRSALQRAKTQPEKLKFCDEVLPPDPDSPVWVPRKAIANSVKCIINNSKNFENLNVSIGREEDELDTDLETDRLLGQQRHDEQPDFFDDKTIWPKTSHISGCELIDSPQSLEDLNLLESAVHPICHKPQTFSSATIRQGIGTSLTSDSPEHCQIIGNADVSLTSPEKLQYTKSPTGSIKSLKDSANIDKKAKARNKEGLLDPTVLIEGVLFRARYLGSTQLVCEGQPTKSTRMMQAEEAVSRIKAPEGESQPSTEVDLFISTEKIMVLNTDLKEIMMDHALRTISYIADIGDLVVLMARRRFVSSPDLCGSDNDVNQCNDNKENDTTCSSSSSGKHNRTPKMICHVFESDEAQFIAQSIGQAFQVAYMEFLKANGIENDNLAKEMDYQEVLNSQEIFGDELEIFAKKELQKEVVVPKAKGEILGVVIVESGWGSMLPTVVIANLMSGGAAARCGQLNIGDQLIAINGLSLVGLPLSTCQNYIRNTKNQTAVKFTVVPCPPVVEVKIIRPKALFQLGFSVQNGVICSLLRGGIAERGGVRVGHRIIEINNQSVVAVPHDTIVKLLSSSVGEILMKTMPTSMFRLLTGQETPIYI